MTDASPNSKPKKRRFPVAAILFLALASLLYLRSVRFHAPKSLDVAGLQLQSLTGKPLAADAVKGKAVILNFWAPWCGPCLSEMPAFERLQNAHRNDLVVIGVVDDPDTYAEAAVFTATHGIHYAIVPRSGALSNEVGTPSTIPVTLYIDPGGKVVHAVTGASVETLIQRYAKDILPGR